jgi:hypothetical protein
LIRREELAAVAARGDFRVALGNGLVLTVRSGGGHHWTPPDYEGLLVLSRPGEGVTFTSLADVERVEPCWPDADEIKLVD